MASRSTEMIAARIRGWTGCALTQDEVLQCEELVLNYYTGSILTHIERLQMKKRIAPSFAYLYRSVINGTLRGAKRWKSAVEMTPRLKAVLRRIDEFKSPMSDGELQSCVHIANFDDHEIAGAESECRSRGVNSVAYLLAILKSNEGKRKERKLERIAKPKKPKGEMVSADDARAAYKKKMEESLYEKLARDMEREGDT